MKFIRIIFVALSLINVGVAHEETRDIGMKDVRPSEDRNMLSTRSLLTSEIDTTDKLDTPRRGRRLSPKGKGGKGGPCTSQSTLLSALSAIDAECTELQSAITTSLSKAPSLVSQYCLLAGNMTTPTIPPPQEPTSNPIVIPAGKGKGKGAASSPTGFYVSQLESFFQEKILPVAQEIDALYVEIQMAESTIASAQLATATLESQRSSIVTQCSFAGVVLSPPPVSTCNITQTKVTSLTPIACSK